MDWGKGKAYEILIAKQQSKTEKRNTTNIKTRIKRRIRQRRVRMFSV